MTGGGAARSQPARLELLDGLRGLAAIGVMFNHLSVPGFSRGWLYVDFFFLLSGFVLTISADPAMRAGLSPQAFMARRVRRLWPVIAAGALIAAGLSLAGNNPGQVGLLLVLNLLMIPCLMRGSDMFPLNSPHWSISAELLANAVHASLLRHLSLRGLCIVAAAAGVALVGVIYLRDPQGLGNDRPLWYLDVIPRVLFPYVCGMILARRWQDHALTPSTGRSAGQPFAAAGALILPTLAVVALPFAPISRQLGEVLFVFVMTPGCFILALKAGAVPDRARSTVRWLGAVSFPLYSVHFPVCMALIAAFGPRIGALAGVAVSFALAAALARQLEGRRVLEFPRPLKPGPA